MSTSKDQFEQNKAKFLDDINTSLDAMFLGATAAPILKSVESTQETEDFIEIPDHLVETLLDRFCIHSNAFDALAVVNASGLMASRINAVLSLVNTRFKEGLNHWPDNDVIYYALHSVSLDINDLKALTQAYKKAWKMGNIKNKTEYHKTFCGIYCAIERAKGVMSLLSCQFAEDDTDHSTNERIRGAIETVKREVEYIRDELSRFHTNGKQKQQA